MEPEDMFAQPPGRGLLKEPIDRLVARLPGPDDAAGAMSDMRDAGVELDEVFIICGDEGVRRLDPSGRHHGLKGRLIRTIQYVTSYGNLIEEDAAHVEAGGVIVTMPAETPDERRAAEDILRQHNASRMRYYSGSTVEDLR